MTPTAYAVILYASVLVNLVLGLVLIIIVGSYQRLLKAINSIARAEALDENKKVFSAKKEAEEIVKNAHKKAEQIVAGSETFSESAQKDLADSLTEILTTEAVAAINDLKKELAQKIESQFMAEKDSKLALAEEQIKKLVTQVARDILGKSIKPEDHERLIKSSLEEVKRQGLF